MPVRQVRRRYLAFRVSSERKFQGKEVADAVQRSVLDLYGIHGLSSIVPSLLEYDEETQGGILRCTHTQLRQMSASLAYITSIGDSAVSIHVEKISGTIKALGLNAFERRRS